MNLALTDPFILAQDYPEALTGKLSKIILLAFLYIPTDQPMPRIWSCHVP